MFLFNYRNSFQRIVTHIVFWVIYLLFFSIMALNPKITYSESLLNGLVFLPVDIFVTYVMIYLLIPFFLMPRHYLLFVFSTIVLAFVTVFLNLSVHYYIYIPTFHPEYLPKRIFWHGNYWYTLVATYTVVIFGAGVKLTKLWVKEQKDKKELENQKIKSELLMLKSQINPHFLFNTLNNIDALIVSNPARASESIIRLSEILRYVTYHTKEDFVDIKMEEDILRSFIELNTLRFGNDYISYTTDIDNTSRIIAPMLLIPLVENAIKHGDKKAPLPAITVQLKVKGDVEFTVTNTMAGEHVQKDETGGVGISNLKRRLDLIYPGNHTFEYFISNNTYTTRLWIR